MTNFRNVDENWIFLLRASKKTARLETRLSTRRKVERKLDHVRFEAEVKQLKAAENSPSDNWYRK